MDGLCWRDCSALRMQVPFREAGFDLAGGGQVDLRKRDRVMEFGIALAVLAGCDHDVPEHVPLHAVFAAFDGSDPVAGEQASTETADEAHGCGDVEEDPACGTRQALGQEPGVVSVDYPSRGFDGGIVQALEVGEWARRPICSGEMV